MPTIQMRATPVVVAGDTTGAMGARVGSGHVVPSYIASEDRLSGTFGSVGWREVEQTTAGTMTKLAV